MCFSPMRTKIYEDDELIIYSKEYVEVDDNADIGSALIEIGLILWLQFADHLENPADKPKFWQVVEEELKKKFDEVRTYQA